MSEEKRVILLALGGNALESPNSEPSAQSQLKTVQEAMKPVADLIEAGNSVIISHGNGPQIGRIILQNEAGKEVTPAQPIDVCGAMTQGAIGYHMQNALSYELKSRGINKQVVSLITQVEVSGDDPAFKSPTKPIGPFYTEEKAKALGAQNGFVYSEDSGRGWRRVVPSPKPINVVESSCAKALIDAGVVVILAGGGGIPVVRTESGELVGVEAVIDKDLSSALLADQLGADDLFVLTAVPKVALNFGKPDQKFLDRINGEEARQYVKEGHFAPGSMLPKVEAAIGFVEKQAGRRAVITALEFASEAFNEKNGTIIVK